MKLGTRLQTLFKIRQRYEVSKSMSGHKKQKKLQEYFVAFLESFYNKSICYFFSNFSKYSTLSFSA